MMLQLVLCTTFLSFVSGLNGKIHSVKTAENNTIILQNKNLDYFIETFVGANGVENIFEDKFWTPLNIVEDEKSGGISKKCCLRLEIFTNATTQFLRCVMSNARPLHYCENCVDQYASVKNAFNDIINETDTTKDDSCKEQLLRADNVQVVLLAYDFVEDVWTKSTCENCYYSIKTENKTVTFHPTNNTRQMLKRINNTLNCMADFMNGEVIPGTKNVSVCILCKKFYNEANKFYDDLDVENQLCSDLKDSMNYTRYMWSNTFNCTIIERSIEKIAGISVAILLLPVILYSSVYLLGQKSRNRRRHRSVNREREPEVTEDDTDLLHAHHS